MQTSEDKYLKLKYLEDKIYKGWSLSFVSRLIDFSTIL